MGGKKPGKRGQELIKLGVRVGQHIEPKLNAIQDLGLGAITEFMATGGVGSQVPAARLAREGAADAVSQGQRETEQSLAASGLLNTPYAAAIRGEQKMRGGLTVNLAERDALNDYLRNFLPGALQAPVSTIAPLLGVGNAPLAAGAAQSAAAGQAAAGAYGAAGNAVGQGFSAFLDNYYRGGNAPTPAPGAPYDAGGGSYGD